MSQIGDWRSAVNTVLGPGEAVELIQQLLATGGRVVIGFGGRPQPQYNWRAFSHLRPDLVEVGLDMYTAVQVEQSFGSGAAARDSATRLGLGDQFAAGGVLGLRPRLG
jgi:hypothetical protein